MKIKITKSKKGDLYYYKQTKVNGKIVLQRIKDEKEITKINREYYKGLKVYTKKGEVNKKSLQSYINYKKLSRADANNLVTLAKDQKSRELRELNLEQLYGKMRSTQIGSWIASSGYTPEELSIELSITYNLEISEQWILDENHWLKTSNPNTGTEHMTSILILPNGQQVEFNIRYENGEVVINYD